MKKTQESAIKVYIMNALVKGKIHKHTEPCRLHLLWIEKDNRRDGDNISFAIKFLQDAMVKCGVFPDDSRKYIRGLYHDFEKGDHYGVVITIEEVKK